MPLPLDTPGLRVLMARHLHRALEVADEREAPLSRHRQRVLAGLATCGDPEHGFMWLRCDPCAVDRVVGLSCKARLVCPRCAGRRMASTAAHLLDHVLPDVPYRQHVLTLPRPLPQLLAWCPDLLERVLSVLARAVERDLRRRTGQPAGKTALVSLLQTERRHVGGDLEHRLQHALGPAQAIDLVPHGLSWIESANPMSLLLGIVPAPCSTVRPIRRTGDASTTSPTRTSPGSASWTGRLRNVNYSYPSATTRIPHGVVVVGGQPALEKRGFSVRSVDGGEAFGRLPLAVGVGRTRHGQTTAAGGRGTLAGLLRARGRGNRLHEVAWAG